MHRSLIAASAVLLSLLLANPAHAFLRIFTSDYTRTQYPIVLAHGLAGFDNIGPVDYWYQIPNDLRRDGARVFVTQVSAFHSSDERGEQLLRQVEEILAITGAEKVNLIGHSQGSKSVRYVAGVIPHRVASVTSVGGGAKGSPVADRILQSGELPVIGEPVDAVRSAIINGFGWLIGVAAGEPLPQDSKASLRSLSAAGTEDFNRRFPAGLPTTACGEGAHVVNGVRYYSWSGTGTLTNLLDPSAYAIGLTGLAFIGTEDSQNDGLVGRCSSRLGQVIRDNYYMDHLDLINQVFGLVSLFEANPKAVFRQHANRLKNAGL